MTAATYLAGSPDGGPALPLCADHRVHRAWLGQTMALRGTPADIAQACTPDRYPLRLGYGYCLPCAACEAVDNAERLGAEDAAADRYSQGWRPILAALLSLFGPPTARDLAGLGTVWVVAYRAARGIDAIAASDVLWVAERRAAEVFAELAGSAR